MVVGPSGTTLHDVCPLDGVTVQAEEVEALLMQQGAWTPWKHSSDLADNVNRHMLGGQQVGPNALLLVLERVLILTWSCLLT